MEAPIKLAPHGAERFPEGLLVERNGAVMTLTIDREDDMNRLIPQVLVRLGLIAEALREDDQTQVLIITGAGSMFFSMGIMNPVIRAQLSKDEVVRLVMMANRVFDAIEALPQIVIACLNGKVLAGAVELCLACDIRYAAEHVTLCMPEAAWGGFPGAGGPVRLPQLVGRARALDLICMAREIDSQAMRDYGIVQELYLGPTLRESVAAIAARMAASGPLATRGAKQIVNTRLEPGFKPARELADTLRRQLEWTHDVDEGIAAHQENRAPRFTGR